MSHHDEKTVGTDFSEDNVGGTKKRKRKADSLSLLNTGRVLYGSKPIPNPHGQPHVVCQGDNNVRTNLATTSVGRKNDINFVNDDANDSSDVSGLRGLHSKRQKVEENHQILTKRNGSLSETGNHHSNTKGVDVNTTGTAAAANTKTTTAAPKSTVIGPSKKISGRGSEAGWTSCPLCGKYSAKKFALGRGIAAHLHAVHTPWKLSKLAKKIARRKQEEEQRRQRLRSSNADGGNKVSHQTKQAKISKQQDGQREPKDYTPTQDEMDSWDEKVLKIVQQLEDEHYLKKYHQGQHGETVPPQDSDSNSVTCITNQNRVLPLDGQPTSVDSSPVANGPIQNDSPERTDRLGKKIQTYRQSLPNFLQAASIGDLQTLKSMAEDAINKDQQHQNKKDINHDTVGSHSSGRKKKSSTPCDDSFLQRLLETRDRHKSTAEHWAAGGGHLNCLEYLWNLQQQLLQQQPLPPQQQQRESILTLQKNELGKTDEHLANNGPDPKIMEGSWKDASAGIRRAISIECQRISQQQSTTETRVDHETAAIASSTKALHDKDSEVVQEIVEAAVVDRTSRGESTEAANKYNASLEPGGQEQEKGINYPQNEGGRRRRQGEGRGQGQTRRRDGKTPLHYAARNGHVSCARFLITIAKVPVDVTSGDGTTPLHMACYGGQLNMVQYLVEEAGADPYKVNEWKCSAAHWVGMTIQKVDVMQVQRLCQLLNKKYDLSFADIQRQGHSVLHKAAQHLNSHVIEWMAAPKSLFSPLPSNNSNAAVAETFLSGNRDKAESGNGPSSDCLVRQSTTQEGENEGQKREHDDINDTNRDSGVTQPMKGMGAALSDSEHKLVGQADDGGHKPSEIWRSAGGDESFAQFMVTNGW